MNFGEYLDYLIQQLRDENRLGYAESTAIISESLGHSSEKVSQIYLDSFENSQIDEAMKNLL